MSVHAIRFALAASLFWAANACAIVFTVDSTEEGIDDDLFNTTCHTSTGHCTLRAAVMQANHIVNEDSTIEVPAGTYILGAAIDNDDERSGDLNLITPASGNPVITINGAGSARTFIVGNGSDRILSVANGRTSEIQNITFTGGKATLGDGGAIQNSGVLTVSNAVVEKSSADYCGGGIGNDNQLGIYNSTISENVAIFGAGLCSDAASGLTVVRSAIVRNLGNHGGGIRNYGTAIVINSTVAENATLTDGGGIENYGSAVIGVYNSTIVRNSANSSRDFYSGGGISNITGGTFNLRNSVVAGNTLSSNTDGDYAPVYNDCWGTFSLYGRNAFYADPCTFTYVEPTSLAYLVPFSELGPLHYNGGPTQTIALLPPSSMIDGAMTTCVNQNNQTLPTDQRGKPRTIGAYCDIGAFEYDPDEVFIDGFDG